MKQEMVVKEDAKVERVEKLTAPEFVNRVKQLLLNAPDRMHFLQLSTVVNSIMELCEEYDRAVEADRIVIDGAISELVAKDQSINDIGLKYNMTLNQVAGFMDLTEQLNAQLVGTGCVVVPFWFYEQYQAMQEKIDALNVETESLIATLERVRSRGGETINLAKRSSIITGNDTFYIPGETGPRVGDEHLDKGFDKHLFN